MAPVNVWPSRSCSLEPAVCIRLVTGLADKFISPEQLAEVRKIAIFRNRVAAAVNGNRCKLSCMLDFHHLYQWSARIVDYISFVSALANSVVKCLPTKIRYALKET